MKTHPFSTAKTITLASSLLCSLLVLSACAGPNSEPVMTLAEAREKGLICRSISTTGSRIGRQRVCATNEQWKQWDQQNSDEAARSLQAYIDRGSWQDPNDNNAPAFAAPGG